MSGSGSYFNITRKYAWIEFLVKHLRSPLNSVVTNCETCLWLISPTTSYEDTTRGSAIYEAVLMLLTERDTQQHLQQLRRGWNADAKELD